MRVHVVSDVHGNADALARAGVAQYERLFAVLPVPTYAIRAMLTCLRW